MKKEWFFVHYHHLPVFLFAVILLVACAPQEGRDSDFIEVDHVRDVEIPLEKVASLKENIEIIGNIISVDFVNSHEFVVSTNNPVSVILYNTDGTQLRKIGTRGRGANEYESPALVKAHNERIYIWCSIFTRLLVFDKDGTAVAEYDYNKAIRDFVVHDDYIFFYTSGGFENRKIIEVYDIASGKIAKEFGDKTNKQLLLELYQAAGGMTLTENDFLFSYNHKPAIYKVSTSDWTKQAYRLNDPYFQVIDIEMTPQDLMKNAVGNAKYIFGSDMITGLYPIENNLVMVGEIGEIQMAGFDIRDFSGRKQRFYVFDLNMKLKYTLSVKADMSFNTGFFSSDGRYL
jgi:hypothetical protein